MEWPQGRAWAVAELPGSRPVPSLSPLPLTPKLLLQPLLAQSSLGCTPHPPASSAHRGGRPLPTARYRG